MILVELRYVPGLQRLLPIPSLETCTATVRELGGRAIDMADTKAFRFTFATMEEAVALCSTLSDHIRPKGFAYDIPELFPFHAIAWGTQKPSPEMWRLSPPGHLLIPADMDFAGTSSWLYEWELWCISGENPALNRISPIRSLLILGHMRQECFFCGSYLHTSEQCPAMWSQPISEFTTNRLSDIHPSLWIEYLKRVRGQENDITSALDMLMLDLRREFTWNFAARLCRSSATHFNELSTSPLKSLDISDLKNLFIAVSNCDLSQIEAALNRTGKKSDASALSIIRGLFFVAIGDIDSAREEWWDAEREADTPMRKCYAALLQARLFFVKGDMAMATSTVNRAMEADQAPIAAYWAMILDALQKGGNRLISNFHALSTSHRLCTATLIEPLLIRHQIEVEATFNRIWRRQEEQALMHVKQIESLIQQAQRAFGPEVVRESAIRLRDWRGRWPRMGYRSLQNSGEFLDDLKAQVMKEIHRKFKHTLSKFPGFENRCRVILSRLPANSSTVIIRRMCRELIRDIRDTALLGRTRDLEKLAGFSERANDIVDRYEKVNGMYQDYIDRAWQKRMILKLLIYGTAFSITAWLAIYIYKLLRV